MSTQTQQTHCSVRRTHLSSVEEVTARLTPLLGTQDGWVQYAGACVVSRAGLAPSAAPEGFPLAAEFVTGASSSVSLRQGGDGWDWVELEETQGGTPCRVQVTERVSTEPGLALGYRVLWARDEAQPPVRPWRPWVARFTGWKAEGRP